MHGIAAITRNMHRSLRYFVLLEHITSIITDCCFKMVTTMKYSTLYFGCFDWHLVEFSHPLDISSYVATFSWHHAWRPVVCKGEVHSHLSTLGRYRHRLTATHHDTREEEGTELKLYIPSLSVATKNL